MKFDTYGKYYTNFGRIKKFKSLNMIKKNTINF